MSFDGSGNYSPAPPPNFPAIAGTAINPTYFNAVINDIATAMSKALCKDGQSVVSANIPMNNKRITGLADAVDPQDALTKKVFDAQTVSKVSTVQRTAPRPRSWTTPTGMNNPLRLQIDCDGQTYAFNQRPYTLTDWSVTATGITHYYIDYTNGNDANAGTSAGVGNAWKTFDKAVASAVDKSIIHLVDRTVGYLSSTAGSQSFGTRRIKIIGDNANGPTVFTGWRESYNLAALAWVADGNAYKTTAAVTPAAIMAMGDAKFPDRWGLPKAMPHVADLATVKATPGSWNWDGTTLSVQMFDSRVPDPADSWVPVTSLSNFNVSSDNHFTVENCTMAYNGGAAAVAPFRFRPVTTGAANTIQLALKNVRSFGGSSNAFEIYDCKIVAMQECYGSHAYYDIFNYSSFISTGTQAQWMTVYEDNCFGHDAGYNWRQNPAASSSNNLTTAHRGMHVWRVNTGGYNIPHSWLAEINGTYSINAGMAPTQSQAGALFQNNYWCQRLVGEGSANAKMILIGCNGDAADAGKYHFSNWDDAETGATLGEIDISDWVGLLTVNYRVGTVLKNYETGALL